KRTLPESLDDLTVQVALVRPGPILGGAVHPYIERRKRLRADPSYRVPYEHPSLEPVLRDTLGAIVFQDQVIEVAMAFAGFYPPDTLVHEAQRRGIEVLPPCVVRSEVLCRVESPEAVRIGLGYVGGVGEAEARLIVEERERGEPFVSISDLAARCGAKPDAL